MLVTLKTLHMKTSRVPSEAAMKTNGWFNWDVVQAVKVVILEMFIILLCEMIRRFLMQRKQEITLCRQKQQ